MWTPAHRHLVQGPSMTLENKTNRMEELETIGEMSSSSSFSVLLNLPLSKLSLVLLARCFLFSVQKIISICFFFKFASFELKRARFTRFGPGMLNNFGLIFQVPLK